MSEELGPGLPTSPFIKMGVFEYKDYKHLLEADAEISYKDKIIKGEVNGESVEFSFDSDNRINLLPSEEMMVVRIDGPEVFALTAKELEDLLT